MAIPIRIYNSSDNNALIKTELLTVADQGTQLFSIGNKSAFTISRQDTPYTGQGDSGTLTDYYIATGLPGGIPVGAIHWNYTEMVENSVDGIVVNHTITENISSTKHFIEDDYSWNNTTLQQSGSRSTVTNYIDVYVFYVPHKPTNLILRSATSGAILHGASGNILHDA